MNLTAASRIGNANSGNAAGDGATALRFKRVGQQQQQLPSQVNGQPRSLEKSGKEYARILYLLETALASHHVKVTHVQVWDVSQPTIVEQFEREVRRCPGVVPLDAWVDVDSLNANNSKRTCFAGASPFQKTTKGCCSRLEPCESHRHQWTESRAFTVSSCRRYLRGERTRKTTRTRKTFSLPGTIVCTCLTAKASRTTTC